MNTVVETKQEVVNNDVLKDVKKAGGFNADRTLADLESKRISWESGSYQTSNKELYGILAACLGFAGHLNTLGQIKARNDGLRQFFKSRNYKYDQESPLATRVVKAVFGNVDRRRISSYSLVLRQAIKESISPLGLADWIESKGGIQEIKLGRSATYISPSTKTEIGKECFDGKIVIGNAKSEYLSHLADADKIGNTCILLAEQMPDGSFDIKAVVRSQAAVNAAYLGLYKQQQEAHERAVADIKAANDADGAIAKQA